MSSLSNPKPTQAETLLTNAQAAEMLDIMPGTLERWRMLRKGPPYFKLGDNVRYRRSDVETWMNARRVSS